MKQDLDDYHRLIGFLRAQGCTEEEAHPVAEQMMNLDSVEREHHEQEA